MADEPIRVAYIDDDKDSLSDIIIDLEGEDPPIEVVESDDFVLGQDTEIPSLVASLFEHKVDAILVDFKLQEYSGCSFNGATLVDEIQKERPGFPVACLTSFADDAINIMKEPFVVFGKNDAQEESFRNKLVKTIRNYQLTLQNAETELNKLISKGDNLDEYERERLLELDDLLEKSLSKSSALPKHIKESSILTELTKISEELGEIIKDIRHD